uniref:Phosphotransferase n=1 Tax=Timema douglasi TaxID=61478 RepID=A0A7R8VMJ1_TIMDO|nr:unnamed protein product [Timema douglasi]
MSARSIPRRDVTPVEWLQAIGSRLPRQPIGSRFLVGSSLRRSPPPSHRHKPSRSLSLHLGVLASFVLQASFLEGRGLRRAVHTARCIYYRYYLVESNSSRSAVLRYVVSSCYRQNSRCSVRANPRVSSSMHTYHVFFRVVTSLRKPLTSKQIACCIKKALVRFTGEREIREECQELVLSDGQVLEIMKRLLTELNRGLGKATHDTADVKCFTTFVQDLPNGTVLYVSWQLFDHIAECLANFMVEHDLSSERLPLGFTFSFPLSQRGLTKGYLVQWTKGFDCSDCINEDVVQMLKDAIARRNDVKIDVCAILNDTTGTLMSCAWKNFNCRIGIIVASGNRGICPPNPPCPALKLLAGYSLGTGSNACYVEKVENVELFEGDKSKPYMVINTEWGAFGDNGALEIVRTQYDREIDSHSINAGKQLHEKMISGMYMGELVRLVLVKFTKSNLLFGGKGSDMLFERGTFFTKFVSEIESDKRGTFTGCRQFDLMLSEDGSGRGAALVAAVACRDR